jgi:hypothetical protein
MAAPTASTAGPRVFASNSITSRRFPALRTLAADDVEVMVMPPASAKKQNAESKPLFDPNVVKPSAVGSLGAARPAKAEAAAAASSGRAMRQRPPFRPCNPTEAKETITEIRNGYVGIHSEYDRAHTLELEERKDAEEHVIGGLYCPSAWSQARKQIEINYFLNSPDAETIEAERRYAPSRRASEHMRGCARAAPRAPLLVSERTSGARHPARRRHSNCLCCVRPLARRYIQEKAQRNMVEYYRRLRPTGPPLQG